MTKTTDKSNAAKKLRETMVDNSSRTPVELTDLTGLGRSTVTKELVKTRREGEATSVAGILPGLTRHTYRHQRSMRRRSRGRRCCWSLTNLMSRCWWNWSWLIRSRPWSWSWSL